MLFRFVFLFWPSQCPHCIIDLKDNVLRVGGGEVSVPFLQGWPSNFSTCLLFNNWTISAVMPELLYLQLTNYVNSFYGQPFW